MITLSVRFEPSKANQPRKSHRIVEFLLLPSATKLRRLCFYTCLSFCSQRGSASVPAEIPHPPRSTPPPEEHPPGSTHPLWEAHHPPGEHTPQKHPPGDGCRCGRYASYCNAFLFWKCLCIVHFEISMWFSLLSAFRFSLNFKNHNWKIACKSAAFWILNQGLTKFRDFVHSQINSRSVD